MRLVVNADDFGYSEGVNNGIVQAHLQGIVTSTTAMVTMPGIFHAKELSDKYPSLKIGLHLNMTCGKPITKCPSLINADGFFYKPKEKPDQTKFNKAELKKEFLAQYETFLNIFKRKPTHLDTHLYAHQVYPLCQEVIKEVALEVDLPVRDLEISGYQKVNFIGWFKVLEHETAADLLNKVYENRFDLIQDDFCELMVHPACIDEYLMNNSSYNTQRLIELSVLTDRGLKQFILDSEIELTSFEESKICQK